MNRASNRISHITLLLPAILGAFLLALHAQTTNSQSPQFHSVWDGIFTDAQAQRAEALFKDECSACHGNKLTGDSSKNAPPLTGHDFEAEWKDRTVGDLFKKIMRKMPQDDPGTLTPQQTADLVAFILSFNKYPSGKVELPPQSEALAAIRFDAKPPDQTKSGSSAQ